MEARKEELWEGEVAAVLTALRAGKGESEVHYFETNRHRMRCAEFRAQGYPIGSGTVESACKRVIGARLKQAGMRWTKMGGSSSPELAGPVAQWPMGRHLARYPPSTQTCLNLGVHPPGGAQTAGLDYVAAAGAHRIPVNSKGADLRSPTPLQGLVDTEHQGSVAPVKMLQQQPATVLVIPQAATTPPGSARDGSGHSSGRR